MTVGGFTYLVALNGPQRQFLLDVVSKYLDEGAQQRALSALWMAPCCRVAAQRLISEMALAEVVFELIRTANTL